MMKRIAIVSAPLLTSLAALLACDNHEADLARAEAEKAKMEAEVEKARAQVATAQAETAKAQAAAEVAKRAPAKEAQNERPSTRKDGAELDQLAETVGLKEDGSRDCPSSDPMCASGRIEVTPTVTITVRERKSDGQPWDAMGGAPDIWVTLSISGKMIQSGPAQDRFTNSFKFNEPISLKSGDTIHVTVIDKDAMQSDPIGSAQVTFRKSGSTVAFSGGSMNGTVVF